MANEIEAVSMPLESTTHIPIAELNDRIPHSASRSVRSIVTLTWPYSSATGSIAFLLAEPDFRLRRSKGQVRVQFSGSSAKQVAKAGIASGDEVILCLDGVEWIRNEAEISAPGRGVEFELKFTERLLLQFQQEESLEVNLIDIDHPTPVPEAATGILSPESTASPSPSMASIYSRPTEINTNEWSSPAFIKRARTSYGSFFDNNYDLYTEEDGTIRGRGRKKTRMSSTWRYNSRSPTPESEPASEHNSPKAAEAPAQMMTDEACQTIEAEVGDAAEVLADLSRRAMNAGSAARIEAASAPEDQVNGQPEVGHEAQNNTMPTPMIQTQFNNNIEVSPARIEAPGGGASRPAPQSPRLRPISSDVLPLVSPLVTSKFGLVSNSLNGPSPIFPANTAVEQTAPEFGSETIVKETAACKSPIQPVPQAFNDDPEGLYGVSPFGHHGQSQWYDDRNGFTIDIDGFNGVAHSSEGQFMSEDQYDRGQSGTAQLGHPVSPPHANARVEELQEHLYIEGEEGSRFGNDSLRTFQNEGLTLLDDQVQHTLQYPEPDDELHVPSFNNQWFPDQNSASVAYPDLPPPADETRNTNRRSPYPQASIISRSQSAHSEVVDLTESDDEQQEKLPVKDEDGDEMSEGSDEEEPYPREGPIQSRYFPPNGDDAAEEGNSQDSGNEHEFDEDEITPDQQYPRYHDLEEEFYDEDDEGSYDEEEMVEDEERPAQSGPPVFIDLLSSDDEDAEDKLAPEPPQPTQSLQQRVYSRDDERLDSKESEDEKFQGEHTEPTVTSFDSLGREHPEESQDEEMVSGDDEDGEDEENIKSIENVSDAGSDISGQVMDVGMAPQDLSAFDPETGSYEDQSESPGPEWTGILEPSHEVEEVPGVADILKLDSKQDVEISSQETLPPRVEQNSRVNPPSIMNEIFGTDGANDSRTEVLYSVAEQSGNSVIISNSEQHSQTASTSETHVIDRDAIQLPTPDDTQSSQTIASQVVFSFTTGPQPVTDLSQESFTQRPIDPALEDNVDIADKPKHVHKIEDVSVIKKDIESVSTTEGEAERLQPTEKTPDVEGDIEMTTVTDVVGTTPLGEESQLHPNLKVSEDDPSGHGDIPLNPREGEDFGDASIVNDEASEPETVESPNIQVNIQNPSSISPVITGDAVQELHKDFSVPSLDDDNESNEETVQVSPRRSQRISKPATSTADSETAPPSTPTRPRRRAEPKSDEFDTLSPPVLHDSTISSGHDPSIEMALSALDSPKKQLHDLRKQPVVDLRVRLSRVLRTELGDFTALKVLRYNLNQKLDVLATATTTPDEPQRSKGGPRNFQMTFNITDPSIAPSGVTEVQILRPYKEALPVITAGDGILLRNFQVVSLKDKGFALRSGQSEGSSWAVFKDGEEDADVRGPPVEYGNVEKMYFVSLREWFRSLDSVATAKLKRANANKAK